MPEKTLHIAIYRWFGLSHITSALHLSNKLAKRGHRISIILPSNTIQKFLPFNQYPELISFIPITVPSVDGLPPGSETTNDAPASLKPLFTAMDLTEPVIESLLINLKPDFVFFDFAHWLPALSRKHGIKSVYYSTVGPSVYGWLLSPERKPLEKSLTPEEFMKPPQNFPPSFIKLRPHEARGYASLTLRSVGSGISLFERIFHSFSNCDAIGFKMSMEMEGPYCNYIERQFDKPVILAGPVIPEPPDSILDEEIARILDSHEPESLIFCAFGSECVLTKEQFQELLLGLELTGLPFLAALKPPIGSGTIESELPEGFEERIKGKGFVYGGWVQQPLILNHPSVGCFITHCGSGSLAEGMVNKCQLVLLPHKADQIINARLMGGDLRVGVEIEKDDENGLFTRDGVCKAVKAVMDYNSEIGKEVKKNHMKWREFLLSQDVQNSYIDAFVDKLYDLLR